MCGITGLAAFAGDAAPRPELLERMCESLRHRGPDDAGLEISGSVGLAARRLAVIDPAGGHQPVQNEDGSVCAVLNGEIYNFEALRERLEKQGHRFRSRTDTEVLVHGWEEWGAELPRHLDGMFAFAVHDRARRRLLLARDPVGIKPLYYAWGPRELVFGSEIKALLESGRVERSLDLDAVAAFLSWEYVPGRATLFQAIRKLPAAHLLEISLDAPRHALRRYWELPAAGPAPMRSAREWEELVASEIQAAVRRQLVSDVPLGAFLSGGVDSSLVTAAMGPAKTFSIGFTDASYDELRWSKKVAAHLGAEHQVEIISPDVVGTFDHLMHFLDDPIGDFSIYPTHLVSKLARREVTVVLSGDGGDELFGGYESYVAQSLDRHWQRLPRRLRVRLTRGILDGLRPDRQKRGWVNMLRRFVQGAEHPPSLHHTRWRVFLDEALRNELFTMEVLDALQVDPFAHVVDALERARGQGRGPVDTALQVDFETYLCDDILCKVDRASMATSLEARVPLLDTAVVSLAFAVPEALKVRGWQTKRLLKRVAARRVPRDCVYRPKQGFSIPIKNWLGGEARELMQDLLVEETLQREGIFRPEVVARLQREHLDGSENHSHLLWSLMVFQAWQRRWARAG